MSLHSRHSRHSRQLFSLGGENQGAVRVRRLPFCTSAEAKERSTPNAELRKKIQSANAFATRFIHSKFEVLPLSSNCRLRSIPISQLLEAHQALRMEGASSGASARVPTRRYALHAKCNFAPKGATTFNSGTRAARNVRGGCSSLWAKKGRFTAALGACNAPLPVPARSASAHSLPVGKACRGEPRVGIYLKRQPAAARGRWARRWSCDAGGRGGSERRGRHAPRDGRYWRCRRGGFRRGRVRRLRFPRRPGRF